MRSLLLALVLAAVPMRAAAQGQSLWPAGWVPVEHNSWGGINLLNDSTKIGPEDATDAQNVLTDSGFLEKRPGNTLLKTILPGYPVQALSEFPSPNGTRYLIAQASQTIYQTDFSGAAVALSSVAAGYSISAVPAFSKFYVADGYRPLWYWDGNSTGTVTDAGSGLAAPICTYIEYKDSRIYCANIPGGQVYGLGIGPSTSGVWISSAGGAGYWYIPSNFATNDSAANYFTFTPNDGDYITCLKSTPWGMFVGKRYSSYMIKGNGNLTYDIRSLDPKIGCMDNHSVQMVYGVLEWMAFDGVYGFNGAGPPQLLSRELDPAMKQVRQGTYSEGLWQTVLQPDWASGIISPSGSWGLNTIPGSIFPSSFTLLDNNRNSISQGGLGFSSDTLVNIDTTTYPLDIGLAQIAFTSAKLDDFSDGDYTTGATTWSVVSTYHGLTVAQTFGSDPSTYYVYRVNSGGDPTRYGEIETTKVLPQAYGTWSFDYNFTNSADNSCGGGTPSDTCIEFGFIVQGSMGFDPCYTLRIDNSPFGGGLYPYKTILLLYSPGSYSRTVLAQTTIPIVHDSKTNFKITRDKAGNMFVYMNGTLELQAQDTNITSSSGTIAINSWTGTLNTGVAVRNGVTNIWANGYSSGSLVSTIYDTGMTTPVAGTLSSTYTLQGVPGQTALAFYLRSSTSPNNDKWSSWTASSNSVWVAMPNRYWQYETLFNTNVSSYTPQLNSVSLKAITTGYYDSKVNFIGTQITSWKQLGVSEANPGVYRYWVRAATYSFTDASSSPTWTQQTANQNISIATGSYDQFRLDSTALTNADSAENISGIFLHWAQGANIPMASTALDRRYYLCVTLSTSPVAPDTCYVRQKTGKWVPWRTYANVQAMGLYNNNMTASAGDTSSKIWSIMQPGVYSDDGQAINAWWTSSDYVGASVFLPKTFYGMWVDAAPVVASSVTFNYMMGKSGTWVSNSPWGVFSLDMGMPLDPSQSPAPVEQGNINQWLPATSGYDQGKYFRFRFSDNTPGSYFRIPSVTTLFGFDHMTTP